MADKHFLQKTLFPSLTSRKLREIREALTGYLFIAPALVLIFIFGIFPVGFALFVSLHKWRIVRSGFAGLSNYTRAIGNLAYVAGFYLSLAALVGAVLMFRKILRKSTENKEAPWLLALPGLLFSGTVISFLRYLWFQLPEFLDIAEKLRGQQRSRELFLRYLREAFYAPQVNSAWQLFLIILGTAVVVTILLGVFRRRQRLSASYQGSFTLLWLGLEVGLGLLWFTYLQVSKAYQTAMETNTDPGIWPQVITISAGILLLILAWLLWTRKTDNDTRRTFWLRILGAFFLLVGGWILIGEIPVILASGDEDLWNGLKVTLFFSAGTVPVQLTLSMFLAILLFQKLRGSALFRMIFFLPYVTPFIASAAIFRQIFANRDTSPINLVLRGLGGEALAWLQESKGVFTIIGRSLGMDVPDWAAGPSLALVVVMIHAVWTYVGYDTVIYLAGLGNIPTELNESAEIDGANKWDVFRYVTFPLLSPTTYFLSLIAIIGTFKAFATLWVFRESLALGTTDTFSVVIFIEFFEKLRYGYASAMAFVLFAIILALTFLNNRFQGSRVFYL